MRRWRNKSLIGDTKQNETYPEDGWRSLEDIGVSAPSVKGDVNADGKCSVLDVIALQKWVLAIPDAELANWRAGDICADNWLDGFDLSLLKRELLTQ